MLKGKSVLEVLKGERKYELHLDPNSPVGEVFDVLHEMLSFVMQKLQEALPKKEEQKDEEAVQERQA